MKIVIIGGTGLIGSKVVAQLEGLGHEAVPAAPNTGVNALTGEGLAEALQGADVAVDVSNAPLFEDAAVMEFFQTSTRNILAAEATAGVRHHVALSVVGSGRLPYSGYMRAKVAQEKLIRESSIPYTIVHATQFFEFVSRIADSMTVGNTVRVPPVLFQPMAADDVASAVCRVAVGEPLNDVVEVAGPEQFRFDELIGRVLAARNDPREVVSDPEARYYGALLAQRSLIPGDGAKLGCITLREWLDNTQGAAATPRSASTQAATAEPEAGRATAAPGAATAPGAQRASLSVEREIEPGAVRGMRIRPATATDAQVQPRLP